MASLETMINWMIQREGKVTYSMASRYGPNSYDCSSAVYYSLIAGGFLSTGTMGNTDTLFGHLEAAGWEKTNTPNRGCIFIWGVRGASGGAAGHTGIFKDKTNIIHCNYGYNGISTNSYSSIWNANGGPPATFYYYPTKEDDKPSNPNALDAPEKQVAWTIWKKDRNNGYSKESIAGKLGSLDVESGMDPTKHEIGGGGFGLAMWTDPNGLDGESYVKSLMNKAGITGDYKGAEAQSDLILWGMVNGQWIGAVEPKTVDGFKSLTDIDTATYAFMKNFERPGVEHLDRRQQAAHYWYNFLKDLSVEGEGFEELKNVGALEYLGTKDGYLVAEGWHFSSGKAVQHIAFMNAETGKEIGRVRVDPTKREDIAEQYQNVLGVVNCGFKARLKVPDGTTVYIVAIRWNTEEEDKLVFDDLFSFELAKNAELEEFAKGNQKFFFEVYTGTSGEKLSFRGNKILNELSWSNELMYVPYTQVVLPIEYSKYFTGREEMRLYINRKVFHGIVTGFDLDKVKELITVDLEHVVSEWEYRQVSTNNAVKNRTINDIYSTLDFRYSNNWYMDFLQDSAQKRIDYVYSRQDKLEGLTKTCELTDDIFWRVGFNSGRKLELGSFGDKKPYILSTKPSSERNIRVIEEPEIIRDFESVINIASVYGEKSDSGMSSMSLREIHEDEDAQLKGFPVVILKNGINNERGYDYVQLAKLAPNNALEYAVIDAESIALESGKAIEGAYAFNDLAPFEVDDEAITDEDRAAAAKTAYDAAIKKLKQSRRTVAFELTTEEMPADVSVGDKIRFIYDNTLLKVEECSNYLKKILSEDDWFYVTRIEYIFDKNGAEYNRVRLEKYLKIERDSTNE